MSEVIYPSQMDPIIRVDRSVRLQYPKWVKEVLHPELEHTGPAEFDITKVELCSHEEQKVGRVCGQVFYRYLETEGMLPSCLGLSDLLAIQAKGIAFYRQYFPGKAIFAPKSAVRGCRGNVYVPYLCAVGDEVVLFWRCLDHDWRGNRSWARFAK